MTNPLYSAALFALLAAAAPPAAWQGGPTARAEIKGDGIAGTATFREVTAISLPGISATEPSSITSPGGSGISSRT